MVKFPLAMTRWRQQPPVFFDSSEVPRAQRYWQKFKRIFVHQTTLDTDVSNDYSLQSAADYCTSCGQLQLAQLPQGPVSGHYVLPPRATPGRKCSTNIPVDPRKAKRVQTQRAYKNKQKARLKELEEKERRCDEEKDEMMKELNGKEHQIRKLQEVMFQLQLDNELRVQVGLPLAWTSHPAAKRP